MKKPITHIENGQELPILDINGDWIYEGDMLRGKTIDGKTADFIVTWSDYRRKWIAINPGEIYDISCSIFNHYELVNP